MELGLHSVRDSPQQDQRRGSAVASLYSLRLELLSLDSMPRSFTLCKASLDTI